MARGFLTPDQVRAVREARAGGESILPLLARFVLPEQLRELRELYSDSGSGRLRLPERRSLAQVGDYVVEGELARGGMGVVYVAQHRALGRRVAIKLMLGDDERAEGRFQTEARVVAQLQHPAIVKVHEVGLHENKPFLVMDLIEGESLQERIERGGPLDPRLAAELCLQMARGLEHAHGRKVLHRDLKPANVLLDAEGRPLITDFGLAKDLTADEREALTRTGQVVGTPSYMPPEQARGRKAEIDERSDVYSLGATLYTLLTGEVPFEGASLMALIAHVVATEPVPPRRHRPAIPADLEAICLRCMEKARERRYPSAAELSADLERFLAGEPVLAPRRGAGRRATTWTSRHRGLVVSLAATLLLLGTAFGVSRLPQVRTRSGQGASEAAAQGQSREERAAARVERTGRIELQRIKRSRATARPAEVLAALEAWLTRFPEHPDRSEVEALSRELGLQVPLRTWEGALKGTFLADGRLVLVYEDAFELLALAGDAPSHRVALPAGVDSVLPTSAGFWLGGRATPGSGGKALAFDAQGEPTQAVTTGLRRIYGLSLSRDGSLLLACGSRGKGGGLQAFALDGPQPELRHEVDLPAPAYGLAVSPDGRSVVVTHGRSGGYTTPLGHNKVRAYELATFEALLDQLVPALPNVAAFLTERLVAVGCNDGAIFQFDLRTGLRVEERPFVGQDLGLMRSSDMVISAQTGAVRGMALSPDGGLIYTVFGEHKARQGGLAVWDAVTHERVRRVTGLQTLTGLAVSGDGQHLLLETSKPNTMQLWRAR